MTVKISTTLNPEGASWASALHATDGMKFLIYGYSVVMLDGNH